LRTYWNALLEEMSAGTKEPMADCCGAANGTQQTPVGFCPSCGLKGKPVATLTVKNLVADHTRVPSDRLFSLCWTTECEVVYFFGKEVFRKSDLKVRVGFKEQQDPIPLCYCFGYDREDLRREIEAQGASKIPDRIKAEVKAGFCACEVKNPAGSCCLGDVNRVAMDLRKSVFATRP